MKPDGSLTRADYIMALAIVLIIGSTGVCAGYLTAALICAVRSLG